MEERLDDGGTGKLDRFQHVVLYGVQVVQDGAVTLKQLDN